MAAYLPRPQRYHCDLDELRGALWARQRADGGRRLWPCDVSAGAIECLQVIAVLTFLSRNSYGKYSDE